MFQTPQHSLQKQQRVASPRQQQKSTVKPFCPITNTNNGQRKIVENYSFSLQDEIGKGFSSHVYRGRNDQTGEEVAIKVIEMRLLKTPFHHALLRSEIEALNISKSENIIKLHQVYQTQNNTYLMTEFCSGGDLGSLLKKEGHLNECTVALLMNGIVNAYRTLKNYQIIHRDLKPANILLSKDGIPKIADFGFATTPRSRQNLPNVNVGSPLYMSPQALAKSQYSEKSDIWSLGVSAYELLYGSVPWSAYSEKELAQKMSTVPCAFPTNQGIIISEECRNFIKLCLTVDEIQRPSIEELEQHPWLKKGLAQQKAQQSAKKALAAPIIQVKQSSVCKPFKQNTLGPHNQSTVNTLVTGHGGKENGLQLKKNDSLKIHSSFHLKENNVIVRNDPMKRNSISMQIEDSANKTDGDFISDRTHDFQKIFRKNDIVILGQINFCRFIFRVVQLLDKSKIGIAKEKLLYLCLKHIIIKTERLKEFLLPNPNDPFQLQLFQNYILADSFKHLSLAIQQYDQKYSLQFTSYWLTLFSLPALKKQLQNDLGNLFNNTIEKDKIFEENLELKIVEELKTIIKNIDQIYTDQLNANSDNTQFVPENVENGLILIDYLITYLQLVTMFKYFDFEGFSQKSHIEQIAQGKPVRLTYAHYNEIKRKIDGLI